MTTTTGLSYGSAPNQLIRAGNGIDYAHREIGSSTVPLVLLQHFRGNLENWDPQLVDALAAQRRVVAFDNAGVGATTGSLAVASWGNRAGARGETPVIRPRLRGKRPA